MDQAIDIRAGGIGRNEYDAPGARFEINRVLEWNEQLFKELFVMLLGQRFHGQPNEILVRATGFDGFDLEGINPRSRFVDSFAIHTRHVCHNAPQRCGLTGCLQFLGGCVHRSAVNDTFGNKLFDDAVE